jgi:rhomboid protease GluP
MTLRGLLREFKDFPSTTTFCVIWTVVFAAMVGSQLAAGIYPPWPKLLLVGIGDGHRFGDLTLIDMARGEYWRLITSTFIHFSLIHLVLNVVAMYQLGTMVESWYGTPQNIFLYGVIAGGGNLVSVVIRHFIGSNPQIHSGGGSVVIMGLVGLCAVAGLRSRTKMGMSLGRIMVFFIVVTAVIGAVFHQYIDNWGHAGGALVGAALGFRHRGFLKAARRPSAWGRGALATIVIAACGVAQAAADRREAPLRIEQNLVRRVALYERTYHVLARVDTLVRQRGDSSTIVKFLDGLLGAPADLHLPIDELRRLHQVAESAAGRPLPDADARDFRARLAPLLEEVRREFLSERKNLWKHRDQARLNRVR